MDTRYVKALLLDTKAEEGAEPTYVFRITKEVEDRAGEVVTAEGWRMSDYLKNPVILDAHDYSSIENILGRTVKLERQGDEWHAEIAFNSSPKGKLAKLLVDSGDLKAVSVGFQSHKMEDPEKPGYGPVKHIDQSLLEISMVPVPMLQDALRVRSAREADKFEHGLFGKSAVLPVTGELWCSVAAAMVALMSPECPLDNEARKRVYIALERIYSLFGKEPPEFKSVVELAALGTAEIKGLFWAGELDMETETKAGRRNSKADEARMQKVLDLMKQAMSEMQSLMGDMMESADGEDEKEDKEKSAEPTFDIDLSAFEALMRKDN